jgi:hypothetical protein
MKRAFVVLSVLLGQAVLAQAVAPPSGGGALLEFVKRAGDTMQGPLKPEVNAGAALGSSSLRWSSLFANNVDLTGALVSTSTATIRGSAADVSSAVGVVVDNSTPLAAASTRLLSIRNAGVERAWINKDGDVLANRFVGLGAQRAYVQGGGGDGATAVSVSVNTPGTWTTAGAKIAIFSNNGERSSIDKDGMLQIGFNSVSARPACDASQRGKLWFASGAAGVADTLSVCRKDAADTYAWANIPL